MRHQQCPELLTRDGLVGREVEATISRRGVIDGIALLYFDELSKPLEINSLHANTLSRDLGPSTSWRGARVLLKPAYGDDDEGIRLEVLSRSLPAKPSSTYQELANRTFGASNHAAIRR